MSKSSTFRLLSSALRKTPLSGYRHMATQMKPALYLMPEEFHLVIKEAWKDAVNNYVQGKGTEASRIK